MAVGRLLSIRRPVPLTLDEAITQGLANSRRLKVGVGVLPVPMRNVAITAMEIAALARAYPGRVRIGLGLGASDWMAKIGDKVALPMNLLRE